ncbi:MAG: PKD domain-containing protein, partial [Nitrososphaerota archaeon]|nr:PKD domain-containing protein [Nitrososphaerota archaeon]
SGVVVIHSFAHPGDYNVTATATDSSGETVTRWAEIHVTSPPLRFDASGFAASVATLFVGVLEGIVEVAVVAVPLFLVGLAVYLPLKSILHGLSRKGSGQAAAPR